jgi:hypothetical protein
MLSYGITDYNELLKGCKTYHENEPRDSMYKVATYLINKFWGDTNEMTDALGVLILTWNAAFYSRFRFNFNKLEVCIGKWLNYFKVNKNKHISSFSIKDTPEIKEIFIDFLQALSITTKKGINERSPVAVAKGIHLLLPNFFPIWDNAISKGYGCHWRDSTDSPEKYVSFIEKIKNNAQVIINSYVKEFNIDNHAAEQRIISLHPLKRLYSIIKMIDEYNYAKYTKKWFNLFE